MGPKIDQKKHNESSAEHKKSQKRNQERKQKPEAQPELEQKDSDTDSKTEDSAQDTEVESDPLEHIFGTQPRSRPQAGPNIKTSRRTKKRQERSKAKEATIKDFLEELLCPICLELFIAATQLGCSHCFCKSCIENHIRLTGHTASCPECRKPISERIFCPLIDLQVETVINCLSPEEQATRIETVQQRSVDIILSESRGIESDTWADDLFIIPPAIRRRETYPQINMRLRRFGRRRRGMD